jgi:hypothetical protein
MNFDILNNRLEMGKESNLSRNRLLEGAEAILSQLLTSLENGDLSLFESCFLHTDELVNIGAETDEIWYGWSDFSLFMKKIIDNHKGHKIQRMDTRIFVNDEGSTAWYSELIDASIESRSEPFRLEGYRHTGVIIRHSGQWRIAQSHISAPISKVE